VVVVDRGLLPACVHTVYCMYNELLFTVYTVTVTVIFLWFYIHVFHVLKAHLQENSDSALVRWPPTNIKNVKIAKIHDL
jgi:hypothetical protein